MNSRFNPPKFGIFEKEPRQNALPNKIIMGPYRTPEQAEEHRKKYGYDNDNYYVAQIGSDHYSPVL